MISLQVNGKRIELDAPTLLTAYLESLGVTPRGVAVEHNGMIIERDAYATTTLGDGDVLEIVRMVGGGCMGATRGLNREAELLPYRCLGFRPLVPGL